MRYPHSVIFKIIVCLLLVAAVVIGVTVSTQQDKGAQTAPDSMQSTASPEPSAQAPETSAPPTAPTESAAPSAQPSAAPAPTAQLAAETCTVSISCTAALQSAQLPDAVRAVLPENGQILGAVTVELEPGDTVWTVLQRAARAHGVALEAQWTPSTGSAYVQGIGQLYELDCGQGSGWMYSVNGAFPNVGCSSYTLQPGDTVRWLYTCDYGHDIGG